MMAGPETSSDGTIFQRTKTDRGRWFLRYAMLYLPLEQDTDNIVQENKIIALLAAEQAAVAGIVAGTSLALTLETIVGAAETQSDDAMVACMLLLDEHDRFASLIAPGLPVAYGATLLESAIGPRSSPFGIAVFSGAPVFSGDIAQDQSWTSGRGAALSHGYRACWAAPIFSARGRILGVLGMLFASSKHPTQAEITLLNVVVRAGAHVIERHASEKYIADSLHQMHQRHQHDETPCEAQYKVPQNAQFALQGGAVESRAQGTEGHAGQETILVVSDDAQVHDTLQAILRDFGYAVLKARDGGSALHVLESGVAIDLLLTDSVLCGAVGSLELGRQAKSLLPELEIMLMAGHSHSAAACADSLAAGVELLTQPFKPEPLLHKVRALLAIKGLSDPSGQSALT
jgi:CheY-like chemotaxis protein